MTAAVAHRRQTAPVERRAPHKRPELRVLDQAASRRRTRRRIAMAILFVIVLVGLFLVAFVHARLVEGQQQLDDIRGRIAELETEKARLARAVDEASSPAVVVDRANELGMIRAEEPVYLLAVRDYGGE
jgi:cell division protein FtsL